MADDPENHTLRLLREIREEQRGNHEDLKTRIDGNTSILNVIAGLVPEHEKRLEALEERERS